MKKAVVCLLFIAMSVSLVFGAGTKEQAGSTGDGTTTIR